MESKKSNESPAGCVTAGCATAGYVAACWVCDCWVYVVACWACDSGANSTTYAVHYRIEDCGG